MIGIFRDRRLNCSLILIQFTYTFLFEGLIGVFYDCKEMIYFHITRSKLRTMSLRGVFVRKHVQTYRRAEQARSQYSFTRDISCEELRINCFVFGYGIYIFNRLTKTKEIIIINSVVTVLTDSDYTVWLLVWSQKILDLSSKTYRFGMP